MASPIKQIEVRSFRGATRTTTIELDPQKKLVVLFGENGSGKTTIVDALDALANGKVGSLDARSSATQREHTQAINSKQENVQITIKAANGASSWKATVKAGKFSVVPATDKPRVRVLRRGSLFELVAAEPKDRYVALAQFINVTNVEQSETALLNASTEAEKQHTNAVSSITSATEGLEKYWIAENRPNKSAMAWARAAIASPPKDVQATLRQLDDVADQLESSVKTKAELTAVQTASKSATSAHNEAEKAVQAEEGGLRASELVDLLTKAKKFLDPPNDLANCPVCENTITIAELRTSLAARLDKCSKLSQLMDTRAKAEKRADVERGKLTTASGKCVEACVRLLAAAQACTEFKAMVKNVQWDAFGELANAKADATQRLSLAEKLVAALEPAKDDLSAKRETLQKAVAQFNGIKAFVNQHDQNEAKAKELETIGANLRKVVKLVQEKRKAFAQKTLNEISAECGRLYAAIHPGENITNIKLLLDGNKKASIDQSTDFEGHKDVPPQAYLSDSHLDTLGFCVWLAVAKKDDPANTILALDDIFSSADASHLTRIVQLLADECPNFCQTFVATHFRQWRDRYRMHSGPGISAQLLELHRWSLNKGIGLTTTKLAIDDLADALNRNPLPRQEVSSQAGILLEGLLDRLAEVYELRLPFRRSGEYTLGELLDASSRLFKALMVSSDSGAGLGAPSAVQPLYDAVNAMKFIRNQVGAHFNASGADIADSDVESFGRATLDLAKAITCAGCGQVPDRKEPDHFRCSCKKCRLTPTEAPKK